MTAGKDGEHDLLNDQEPPVNADGDATGSQADAGDEGAEPTPEERVAALEAELATMKDRWLRAVADHDNYKKRVKRDIEDAEMRKVQSLLPAFLPVMDNLERALEAVDPVQRNASEANTANIQQLVTGLKMVRDEFNAALARHDIAPIKSVGEPFDPAVHDALQQIDSPDHAPGVVIREFERGYTLGQRLLRPARVIVAGSGSTGTPPESSDQEN